MKVINDYCNHCNSQRTVVEIDNEEAIPIFNICFVCINHASDLLKEDKINKPHDWWNANVGIISEEDKAMMHANFIVSSSLKGMK